MCGCSGAKKVDLLKNSIVENGFYIVNLCDGYRIKYKSDVYYLEKGNDIYISSKAELIKWAKDNCGMDI